MLVSRTLVGVLAGVLVTTLPSQARAGQKGNEILAEVNGQQVTYAELEQKQRAKLLEVQYQYYRAERDALDQFIDDQLFEMQARRDHLTVSELLKREVLSRVKDPTEDQLQVYYEGVQTDEPYAAVRDKILNSIRQSRIAKARAAYIKSLRSQANIHIKLSPPSTTVAVGDAPMRGPKDASVLLVEFADYQCPYCRKVHLELKKLEDEYSGRLALVFKDFPLPMHSQAKKAAEAARCAGAQGKFWEFHDLLFETKNLEVSQPKEYARTLKLDSALFDQCLSSDEQAAAVQKNLAEGKALGLTGTPSFFVNGHFFSGAVSYEELRELVDQQLTASMVKTARR